MAGNGGGPGANVQRVPGVALLVRRGLYQSLCAHSTAVFAWCGSTNEYGAVSPHFPLVALHMAGGQSHAASAYPNLTHSSSRTCWSSVRAVVFFSGVWLAVLD